MSSKLLSRSVVTCLQRSLFLKVAVDYCSSYLRSEVLEMMLQPLRLTSKLVLPFSFVLRKASFAVRVVRSLRTGVDLVTRYQLCDLLIVLVNRSRSSSHTECASDESGAMSASGCRVCL